MPLLTPPRVAIVAARIARLAALSHDDQLRAAALVLKRDFGVASPTLRLAAVALNAERALIAYATGGDSNDPIDTSAPAIDARWLSAVVDGTIYWIANETRANTHDAFLLSDLGAATIEQWHAGDAAPTVLTSLIGERARNKERARVVIVESSHAASGIEDETLALWRASFGAEFERGALPGVANEIELSRVPAVQATQAHTGLDRALTASVCASALCAALALWRFIDAPAAATAATATTSANANERSASLAAGELWARATLAAPKLNDAMRSANFGGGAWIVVMPSLPREAIPSIESALSSNTLASQTVLDPEIRVRVQRP
jgi:hypothetical protein